MQKVILLIATFLILSSTIHAQTEKEWEKIGRGLIGVYDCLHGPAKYSTKYSEYNNLIKTIEKKNQVAEFLSCELKGDENYGKYYKGEKYYLNFLLENRLYDNQINLSFNSQMGEKDFLIQYAKFKYLSKVTFYLRQDIESKLSSAYNLKDSEEYQALLKISGIVSQWASQVKEAGASAKNGISNDQFGCLNYEFYQYVKKEDEKNKELLKSIYAMSSIDEFSSLKQKLREKYSLSADPKSGSSIYINVEGLSLSEIKALVDEILEKAPSYRLQMQEEIRAEKAVQSTMARRRDVPVVWLSIDNEISMGSVKSNDEISEIDIVKNLKKYGNFKITVKFPQLKKSDFGFCLVFNYTNCKNLKEIGKDKGTIDQGGVILTEYDKILFELECDMIDFDKVDQTSRYIANKFVIQFLPMSEKVKNQKRPLLRGSSLLAYPYIAGGVTNRRNLEEEKMERIREYFNNSSEPKKESLTSYSGKWDVKNLDNKRFDLVHPSKGTERHLVVLHDGLDNTTQIEIRTNGVSMYSSWYNFKYGSVSSGTDYEGKPIKAEVSSLSEAIIWTIDKMLVNRYSNE